jgi:hypothetical protein
MRGQGHAAAPTVRIHLAPPSIRGEFQFWRQFGSEINRCDGVSEYESSFAIRGGGAPLRSAGVSRSPS